MARVSQLCRDYSFCSLHARRLLGCADVSVSSRRTNLHFAMVFTWCDSLFAMAVRGRPVNAFRLPFAGVDAGGCLLSVRVESSHPLVRRNPPSDALLVHTKGIGTQA